LRRSSPPGRTIRLVLSSTKATSVSASSISWNINCPEIGMLAEGTRIRPLSVAMAQSIVNNQIASLQVNGILLKDSFYSDGSYAPFIITLPTATSSSDYTGYTARPPVIANVNCLLNNTITVVYAPDSTQTPALNGGLQIVLAIEEGPANDKN